MIADVRVSSSWRKERPVKEEMAGTLGVNKKEEKTQELGIQSTVINF